MNYQIMTQAFLLKLEYGEIRRKEYNNGLQPSQGIGYSVVFFDIRSFVCSLFPKSIF